jgi:site-specific recombinase XerD
MKLSKEVEIYVSMRQQLGFKMQNIKNVLRGFAAYVEEKKASHITTKLALEYAMHNPHCSHFQQHVKLRIIRRFALYLRTLDQATEVPPEHLLKCSYHRPAPYIYSDSEISNILTVLYDLPSTSALGRLTNYTLFGLLAATGMRISEALSLRRESVDLSRGVIMIQESKFKKSRKIPIHASVKRALKKYALYRDSHARLSSPFFFVTGQGKELKARSFRAAFDKALFQAGLTGGRKPRVMDLRHTFAVKTLVRCHKTRGDATARIVALSRYLGHENPANTYWYFSATTELLNQINNRVEKTFGGNL